MKERMMKFSLDCSKVGNQLCIDGIRQGDSNSVTFIISLTNGINLLDIISGEEESVVVTMYGKKADGKTIVRDCGINEDGNIVYTIHTQDTSCVGLVSYQLVVTTTKEKILASPVFCVMVEKRNLYKTYTVLTAEPEDWADNYDRYYYYEDGRFYKFNKYERETVPEFVINTYYTVNNDEVESTSDFDALSYALLRAKQYADKAEQYLEEVQKKADKTDVAKAIDEVNQTIADNKALADTSLERLSEGMNTKADKDVVDALDSRVEANTEAISGKASKSTTLSGYGIEDAYTKTESDNLLNDKANNTDIDSVKANIKTISDSLNKKADISAINTLNDMVNTNSGAIANKYDASNIEYGTATLEVYSTQTNKTKSATCEYIKIGNTVIANVHLVMNETTVGGGGVLHFLNMPFRGARLTRCVGVSSSNNYICKGQITTSAWFQMVYSQRATMSFADGEEVDFTIHYKILGS